MDKEGSNQEIILDLLKKIESNRKKLRAKVSVILKQVEEFVLNKKPKFSEQEIRLLFLADGQKKLSGLVQLMGMKSKFKGSLKKGSFNALKLVLKILTESEQKQDFLDVFTEMEDEEMALMCLDEHLSAKKYENFEPYRLCALIYNKRKFLELSVYISANSMRKKFLAWYEKSKKEAEAKDATAEGATWDEEGEAGKDRKQMAARFMKFIRKGAEDTRIFYELDLPRTNDYFVQTFYDYLAPYMNLEQPEEPDSPGKMRILEAKRKNEYNGLNPEDFRPNIEKLHIESESFDPYYFLEVLYSDFDPKLLATSVEALGEQIEEDLKLKRRLIKYNCYRFTLIERSLQNLQATFIITEADPGKGRTFDVKLELKKFRSELDEIVDPLINPKQEADKYNCVIDLLDRFKKVINVGQRAKYLILKKDLDGLCKLYQITMETLNKYKLLPVFKTVFEEFNKSIKEAWTIAINKITLTSKKIDVITETIHQLFILEFPGNPIEKALDKLIEELHMNTKEYFQKSCNAVSFKQFVENRQSSTFFVKHKDTQQPLSKRHEEEEESSLKTFDDLRVEGDGILKFIQNFTEYTEDTALLNSQNVESFANEFLTHIDLLYRLRRLILGGEFEKRLKVAFTNHEEVTTKTIDKLNFGLNETWKLVFEHLEKIVEQDLKVFESSKKFRSRLQEDLFNLGRALGKIDNCLRKLDIAFDQFKQIKIKTIQLYLIQSHEDLVNNRFTKINFTRDAGLTKDHMGYLHSGFITEITSIIENNIKKIKGFGIFDTLEVARTQIMSKYFSKFLVKLIEIMCAKLTESSDSTTTQDVSTNVLIAISNLKYFVDFYFNKMARRFCDELNLPDQENFKNDMINVLKQSFPAELKKLKMKYVGLKLGAIKDCVFDINPAIEMSQATTDFNFHFNVAYNNFVLSDPEEFHLRFYIHDILANLVLIYDELNNHSAFLVTEMITQIIEESSMILLMAFKNRLKKEDKANIKQCWLELEFYDNITRKFQSEKARKIINDGFTGMKGLYFNEGESTSGEIFTASEINQKKKLIRNNRFKYQHNFAVLLT